MANKNYPYDKEKRCPQNCVYLEGDGAGHGFCCRAKNKGLKDRQTRGGKYIPIALPHCREYTVARNHNEEV